MQTESALRHSAAEELTAPPVSPLHKPYRSYLEQLAPSTRATARYRLTRVAAILWPGADVESAPWHTVDASTVANLRARLEDRYRFDNVNNHLHAVRGVLRMCWMLGITSTDQYERARAVPTIAGSALPAGHYVEDSAWNRLFAFLDTDNTTAGIRDMCALVLLRGSGCRRHELVALDIDDVDLSRLVLRFRTAKGNRQRESALPEWTRDALLAYMRVRGPMPGALFFRMRGTTLGFGERLSKEGLHRAFKARATQAGMPEVTLHDMRRGYITSALDAGNDAILVARQVGHQQVQTTMRYDRRPLRKLQTMAQNIPSPFAKEDAKFDREFDGKPSPWIADESDVEEESE
jgi:integrase/recombinase XerD